MRYWLQSLLNDKDFFSFFLMWEKPEEDMEEIPRPQWDKWWAVWFTGALGTRGFPVPLPSQPSSRHKWLASLSTGLIYNWPKEDSIGGCRVYVCVCDRESWASVNGLKHSNQKKFFFLVMKTFNIYPLSRRCFIRA